MANRDLRSIRGLRLFPSITAFFNQFIFYRTWPAVSYWRYWLNQKELEDAQYGESNPRHEGRLNKKKSKFLPPPTKLQPFKKGVRFFAAATVDIISTGLHLWQFSNSFRLSMTFSFLCLLKFVFWQNKPECIYGLTVCKCPISSQTVKYRYKFKSNQKKFFQKCLHGPPKVCTKFGVSSTSLS